VKFHYAIVLGVVRREKGEIILTRLTFSLLLFLPAGAPSPPESTTVSVSDLGHS